VRAHDDFSGLAGVDVDVVSDEPATGDVEVVAESVVRVRATRLGTGDGRTNTVTAVAADAADNRTTLSGDCTVPHDRRP
jgi:hypothetical protein